MSRGNAWTIAGVDPSGAAGVVADVRTMSALGVTPACVVTATTAQGLRHFIATHPVAADIVAAQLDALRDQPQPKAIKLGMLATAATARSVATRLEQCTAYVIIDPVLTSSSGGALADRDCLNVYRQRLLPRADLLTPNLPEASALLDRPITSLGAMTGAAEELVERGAKAVLIKGGHLDDDRTTDRLAIDYYRDRQGRTAWIATPRLSRSARGTGCTLSAGIAAGVALGQEPLDAIVMGRAYLQRGLRLATDAVLAHAPWPVTAEDFPWWSPRLDEVVERRRFANVGPKRLGFYPIVDRAAWLPRLAAQGVDLVQLRVKDLTGEALAREIADAVAIARVADLRLFVNDHWRQAIALDAYGVHLGQEDLETADLQAIAGSGLRLGLSTHSYAELARAGAVDASYIALGPIHPTSCKSMRFGPQGVARIVEWRALTQRPLVAIGGLRCEEAKDLVALGADGIAVVSDITAAADPERRAREWLRTLR